MNLNRLKGKSNTYIFGNGTSRLYNVDFNRLSKTGILIGCNKFFQEYHPDFLVAVDETQVKLIKKSDYKGFLVHRTREQKYFRIHDCEFGNWEHYFRDNGCASGSLAISVGCNILPEERDVFLFGFDLYSDNNVVNNIYAGSGDGYVDKYHPPITPSNFIKQMFDIFVRHPYKIFYRVGRENDPVPKEWVGLDNIEFISYNQFEDILKISEYFNKGGE